LNDSVQALRGLALPQLDKYRAIIFDIKQAISRLKPSPRFYRMSS